MILTAAWNAVLVLPIVRSRRSMSTQTMVVAVPPISSIAGFPSYEVKSARNAVEAGRSCVRMVTLNLKAVETWGRSR